MFSEDAAWIHFLVLARRSAFRRIESFEGFSLCSSKVCPTECRRYYRVWTEPYTHLENVPPDKIPWPLLLPSKFMEPQAITHITPKLVCRSFPKCWVIDWVLLIHMTFRYTCHLAHFTTITGAHVAWWYVSGDWSSLSDWLWLDYSKFFPISFACALY